ncbi:uncharacterized protein BKCO1_3000142 [Diplodia corticola]|uniref:EF-hand domain-containing protein n=1 Tax=Diplodia corticola TaxID=236234 RepID=A0A1J9RBW6_9PEZI|nr:uncharacterized protein BKCO1_3000142 [Diplodia corticola]OJD39086.1 hypothetical protein BKCO1_3000142 [Diplodia corticola]
MALDKDKDKTLSTAEIEAMLKQSEKQEQAAHKRATKAAKRFAKHELSKFTSPKTHGAAEEEDFATGIRKQLANVGGYLYKPDYQHARLRTEPPCNRPEHSEYTKKQMRGEKEEEGKQKERVEDPEMKTTGVKDFAPHSGPSASSGLSTKKKVDEAAEAIMPNIQRLSLFANLEDSESDEDSVISSAPSKGSGKGSPMTAIPNVGLSKFSSIMGTTAVESSTSPNANAFKSGQTSSAIHNDKPTEVSSAARSRSSSAGQGTIKPVHEKTGELDSAERVHPWPNLWSAYAQKPPTLAPNQWSIINANLKTLNGPENGRISPCDQENLEAYNQVHEILEESWLVMTGQVPPDGSLVAQKIVKPMLQKEKPDMGARLRVYEEKLTLRRTVLKLPGEEWKRLSGESDKSTSSSSAPSMGTPIPLASPPFMPSSPMGTGSPLTRSFNSPYTVGPDDFTDSPTSPNTSKRSSVSNMRDSTQSDLQNSVDEADSKTSSAHSSFRGHPGAQTPSRRSRLASFTSALKVSKSPKKGSKSQDTSGAAGRDIVMTPIDAPPVPIIPATFSAQNTPQTSFDTTASSTDTPLTNASPQVPSLNRKVSRSFGGNPSTSMAGLMRKKSTSFDGTLGLGSGEQQTNLESADATMNAQLLAEKKQSASFSGTSTTGVMSPAIPDLSMFSQSARTPATLSSADFSFVSGAARYTPNASMTDLGATKRSRKHSRTSSGVSMSNNAIDAHLDELLNEYRAWIDGKDGLMDDNSRRSERPDVKEILKPIDYEEIRKLKPREFEAMANEVKKITHADLRAQVLKEHHDARFPPGVPGRPASSFAALPYLALRIARNALDVVNEHFLHQLNCDYEIENHHYSKRERDWSEACPGAVYPYPGVSRPTKKSYLRAGYAAAWATRFVQWAQEQEQLWKYENIDLPTMGEPGGGFKRPGRTLEAKLLLNMVDEEMDIDGSTGDLKVEGEGAILKEDQVREMFERLARRENQKGTKKVWAACEEQVKRLAMMMDLEKYERLGTSVATGRSSPEEFLRTRPKESALARAGLYAGV